MIERFLDDILCLRLNGPSTAEEFAEGTADPHVELTPFSRACASLWRVLFGNRFGHYNAKAIAAARWKRKQAPGQFASTVGGVLGAARLAVLDARKARRSGSVVHAGAGTSESALWNASMTKYQKRSRQQNIPGAVLTRTSPGGPFICPAKVHLQKRQAASGAPARTRPYAKVAFLGGAAQQCPGLSSTTLIGPHRCAQADLVVVPDLSLLHDVDALAAEVDLAVSVFYIVSLGVDITTQTQLAAVQGSPRRLAVQHCVRHVSASGEKEVRFCVGPRLAVEAPDVQRALRRIARAPK